MTEGSLQHLIENKHLEMRGIFNRAALLSLPVEVNYAKNFANHWMNDLGSTALQHN